MPSHLRSPRALSDWLELDYFRRRRLLPAWGWWLLAGLLAGVVTLATLYAARGDRAFQAGPLSRPHALFNHDCGKCHTSNGTTLTRLWRGDAVGSVEDSACMKCHTAADHKGHPGPIGRCVECHKEHRGHEAVVRLPDATCLRCHADRVTAFDARHHPPFATPADPGTVAFNHAAHLAPEGVLTAARSKDGEPVRKELRCADCHVTDEEGRRMRPVAYERHCQSCHPLGANLVCDWRDPARLHQANQFRDAFLGRIAHPRPGQTAAGVRASLRDALTRFVLDPRHQGFLGGGDAPPPRLPDRDATAAVPEAAFGWVNGQMAEVERVLFDGPGGCRYCHAVKRQGGGLPEVAAAAIPARWWKNATFNHEPHRMVSCNECHAATKSVKSSDVMISDRESCVRCHKPGGAGAGCVECHVFHDEEAMRAGRTKRALDVDWLRKRGQ
ncbi:MAG: hypothetical protein ACRC33_09855 [Gemmataceae bacterium]